MVSKWNIGTDPDKVVAVTEWNKGTNLTDGKAFLGFVGYCGRFFRDFCRLD